MGRLFGTDGVRGIANTELTCERAMQIGRAAAEVLSLAAGAESAEEPQAASNMAQHRITGISFFIGQVLLLL